MPLILDHVSYSYNSEDKNSTPALFDVSLVIPDGQFIGLIGHTGSGKSTLVQLLNALLKPTSGNIYYDGADINDSDYDRKALRSKVGLVFQYPEHQLFEETVFKDVCFGPKNIGLDEKEISLRAFNALEQVGLEHEYFYQSVFDLSGGQKRRVAIAGVLAMKPKVLILDEPTAGLDPLGAEKMLTLIRKLQQENSMTVILVSHSMEDVAQYTDRIIVMNKGRVLLDDEPVKVFREEEKLKEAGLAVPEVTAVVRELARTGLKVDTDVITVEKAAQTILKALMDRND